MIHNLFFNGHVFGSMCVRQNRNFFVLKGIFGLLFILLLKISTDSGKFIIGSCYHSNQKNCMRNETMKEIFIEYK